MRISSAAFTASAATRADCPTDGLPEIILAGRSNVGKSSLVNACVNRKGLAHTSSEPGKTRTINFYRVNDAFYLVDLPGYGYANAPGPVRRQWAAMVEGYLNSSNAIAGAMVIMDARRDPGDLELDLLSWLKNLSIPAEIVATKSDKLTANRLSQRAAALKKGFDGRAPILFSAHTGAGKAQVLAKVADFLAGFDKSRANLHGFLDQRKKSLFSSEN